MARPSRPPAPARFAPLLPLLASLLLFATPSSAAWDPAGEIVPSVGCGYSLAACVDGEGGLFTFWTENRGTGLALFAHRRLAHGETAPGWPESGVEVAPASPHTSGLEAVPDGSGGAFVLSRTMFLSSPDKRLWLWHVSPDGTHDPAWPDSGHALQGGGRGKLGRPVSDGLGGVFVCWIEYLDQQFSPPATLRALHEVRVTRFAGNGLMARGWQRTGKVVFAPKPASVPSQLWGFPNLEADGTGGLFVAHVDSSDGALESRLFKLTSRGTPAPGWNPAGVSIAAPEREIKVADVALDADGGVYALAYEGIWPAVVSRLVRLDASGEPPAGWSDDGFVLHPGVGDARFPVGVVADGSGGALLATLEVTGGTHVTQRFLRLADDGTPAIGWTASGLSIPDDLAVNGNRVFADGENGMWVVVDQQRPEAPRSRTIVRRVTAAGTFPAEWPPEGTVLIDWNGVFTAPLATVDGPRAVYAVNTTEPACSTLAYRVGAAPEASARNASAPTPSGVISELRVTPNPARESAEFHMQLTRPAAVTIEVLDVGGRLLRTYSREFPAGEHGVHWDGNDAAGRRTPPGIYFVRAWDAVGLTMARLVRLR